MPPLSWRHHTLIQALLSRGPLKEDDFLSIFSQVTGKSGSHQQLFNEYLRKINAELSYAQLELRASRNQYNGDVYYGVINNVSDDQSKLGTKYTVPQIAFYKGIVEAIIHDEEAKGSIFSTDALNIRLESQVNGVNDPESEAGPSQIPPAFRNFSMSQKEKTLEQLIKDQWLCSIQYGKIGIGARTFLDLRSWFRTNGVSACEVCNEAAVKAERCQNEDCNIRLHLYCLKKKFSQQRVERVCPGCGTKWRGSVVKAEAAEEVQHDEAQSCNPDLPEFTRKRQRNSNTKHDSSTRKKQQKCNTEHDPGMAPVSDSSSCAGPIVSKRMTRTSARLNAN